MVGKLQWASQNCFAKLGRVMVRPFYAQQYAPLRAGKLSSALRMAAAWWRCVLSYGLSGKLGIVETKRDVDARSIFLIIRPDAKSAVVSDHRACNYPSVVGSILLLTPVRRKLKFKLGAVFLNTRVVESCQNSIVGFVGELNESHLIHQVG